MIPIRAIGSTLLALSLFGCGGEGDGQADPGTSVKTAIRLAIPILPEETAVSTAEAVAGPLAFPSPPIYDFQSGILSPTNTSSEAEEHIAINPLNSCVWMAVVSDFSIRGGFNTTKYSITYDAGTTWNQGFLPHNAASVTTSDGHSFDANSDPVVAFDRQGRIYITSLYFNSGSKPNGIYIAVAPAGSAGSPFSLTSANILPVVTNLTNPINNDEDKEWVTVDNSTGSSAFKGRIYVCWSRFNTKGSGNSRIMLTWSANQGASWSAPIQVSIPGSPPAQPTGQNGRVQGSQVAVGPDGTVYVVYDCIVSGGHQTFFTKSSNGGVAWTAPVAMTTLPFNELSFTATYRFDSFPYLAVNPNPVSGQSYGEIYVVYPDQPTANSAIEFIRSTDNGATFSAPIVLNDVTTGQRLMPSITADPLNNLHVSWFDTRNGADAQTYDIYAARGVLAAGSITWGSANVRVTPPPSITTSSGFIGDYGAIASTTIPDVDAGGPFTWGVAVPVWSGFGATQILKAAVLAWR